MAAVFRLRVTDMRDREILGLVADHADDLEGYATTQEIAEALWPRAMNGHDASAIKAATGAVSTRLAWMVRYGVIERGLAKDGLRRWRLTEEGHALLAGKLTRSAERDLTDMSGMQPVIAIHALTERSEDSELVRTLMRRAWQYGTGRR